MDKSKNFSRSNCLLLAVLVIGLGARLLVATRGHNFDMVSYLIVADITHHGGNVYVETDRYNYGPVWFQILRSLYLLAGHHIMGFRYLIAFFLSLVDVGIFFILRRKFGNIIACLFFLNPVSIIITGFHSQFDNLAILLGLVAVLLIGDEFEKPIRGKKLFGLLVLGLSLMTKHLLFAFPFWLAVKQKGLSEKLKMILVPTLVFAFGFVPYWFEGRQGIIQNVFLYRSKINEYFYSMFVPMSMQQMFNSQMLWLFLLGIFAFIYRRKNSIESLLLYTCLLVMATPALVNQYLAIPVPFVATHLNPFTILFTIIGTLHLLFDPDGLHIPFFTSTIRDVISSYTFSYAVLALCFALVWVTWRQNIITLFKRCVFELENRFGHKNDC